MHTSLIINRESDFQSVTWSFIIFGFSIVLDTYSVMERESKKHKFKMKQYYGRIDKRDSTLREDEVPFTEDIKKK